MCVPRRHLSVSRSENLFHQHGSIHKLPVLAEILDAARRRVGEVHLISLRVEHRIRSKRLVVGPVVGLANVFRLVDQIESVVIAAAL